MRIYFTSINAHRLPMHSPVPTCSDLYAGFVCDPGEHFLNNCSIFIRAAVVSLSSKTGANSRDIVIVCFLCCLPLL